MSEGKWDGEERRSAYTYLDKQVHELEKHSHRLDLSIASLQSLFTSEFGDKDIKGNLYVHLGTINKNMDELKRIQIEHDKRDERVQARQNERLEKLEAWRTGLAMCIALLAFIISVGFTYFR